MTSPSDRLAEIIRARLAAATPGPWRSGLTVGVRSDDGVVAIAVHTEDRDLIAHAPGDLAWLLDELARLRAIEAAATDLFPWAENWLPDEAKDQGARVVLHALRKALGGEP